MMITSQLFKTIIILIDFNQRSTDKINIVANKWIILFGGCPIVPFIVKNNAKIMITLSVVIFRCLREYDSFEK